MKLHFAASAFSVGLIVFSILITPRVFGANRDFIDADSRNRDSVQCRSEDHEKLYRLLCELNSGWKTAQPNFDSLTTNKLNPNTYNDLIQVHLLLVIQRLEKVETNNLSAIQIENRKKHIQVLKGYAERGQFPVNVFVQGLRPVFIDPWGTHCAVGYLMKESGNEELALQVNLEHQLDYLADIKTKGVLQWQQSSGLTGQELALIQPSYSYVELNYPDEIEALILGDSSKIRDALKEDPTLVHARCGGKTILHFAAAVGDLELCKHLVELGADIEAVSKLGRPGKKKEDKDTEKRNPKNDSPVRIGHPRYRFTVYHVRWNEDTLVNSKSKSGTRRHWGVGGRIMRDDKGRSIATFLRDMRGGIEGKSALYFASGKIDLWMPIKIKDSQEKKMLSELNAKRAAVAEWLKNQLDQLNADTE